MTESKPTFTQLLDFPLRLGESPVWDAARRALWFVDSLRPALFLLDPATREVSTFEMPAEIGSLGLTRDDRLVVALRTGVHLFDPRDGSLAFLVNPEPDMPMNRLNDGKVGPDGCFWVGSMHDAKPREPTGALYRVSPAGECTRVVSGLRVSNGLAWSPDGRTMYHANSRPSAITAYPFDPLAGVTGEGRPFAAPDEETGLPDGAAVDADGFYWSAGITGGRLNRFAPDGSLAGSIETPMRAPTMLCFGGDDMRTMFITSFTSSHGGEGSDGTLVSCRVDTPGVPVHLFG